MKLRRFLFFLDWVMWFEVIERERIMVLTSDRPELKYTSGSYRDYQCTVMYPNCFPQFASHNRHPLPGNLIPTC